MQILAYFNSLLCTLSRAKVNLVFWKIVISITVETDSSLTADIHQIS